MMKKVSNLIAGYLLSGMNVKELSADEITKEIDSCVAQAQQVLTKVYADQPLAVNTLVEELNSKASVDGDAIFKALLEEMKVYFGKTYDCDTTELSDESVGTLMDLVDMSSVDLVHTFVDVIFDGGE